MPENFLERVRKVVGETALPDLSELDRSNDLHVDRAAMALFRKFKQTDGMDAYELLVDLAVDRVAALAEDAARDLGLMEAADELVERFFESLFIDLTPAPPESASFLRMASDALREAAESRVRDIALSSAHDPEGAVLWEDGVPKVLADDGALHTRATRICYHRLDVPYRRILRAREVERMTPKEIATLMVLSPDEVDALLKEAEQRLAEAVDRELNGGDA